MFCYYCSGVAWIQESFGIAVLLYSFFPYSYFLQKKSFPFSFSDRFFLQKIFCNRSLAAEKPCLSFGLYYTFRDHNSICLWWGQVPSCTTISCRWEQGQYKQNYVSWLLVIAFQTATRNLSFLVCSITNHIRLIF